MTLLDEMLAEKNLTRQDFDRARAKTEVTGRPFMPKNGVTNSKELRRILALPRRTWEDRGDELVDLLTEHLRAPGGTQRLRPVQAAALQEAHDFGGVFSTARVGAGKSLISFLSFVVLESKRPVLLVPAKLVEKTRRDMAQYRKHWLVPAYIRIISYEILGRERGATFLAEANPDVLVMDECFPYHAKVLTDVGLVSIGDIVEKNIGSRVPCYPAGPDYEWKPIVRRMKRDPRTDFVRVTYLEPLDTDRVPRTYRERSIVCTPEHKIAQPTEGLYGWTRYVAAKDLVLGEHLLLLGGATARVAHVESIELLSQPVYDIEVAEKHNYYVTFGDSAGVLVSNCHRIRNTRAAVTRRVKYFLSENEKAVDRNEAVRTRVVAMSGTVTKRSLHDYAHITAWCLKRTNPVPEDFNARMEWSLILDEKRNEQAKLAPGALINLCNEEEKAQYQIDPIVTIRRAYRRRLVETPGVVATQEGALGTSLSITSQTLIALELAPHFFALKKKWERPDGEPILDRLEMWRHLRALAACGMFYRWNPPPPKPWLEQRKAWARAVRGVLQRGIPGLDSESPIVTAMDKHHAQMLEMQKPPEARDVDIVGWKSPFTDEYVLPMQQELEKWRVIRETFSPQTEAVWLSDVQLKAAAKWMSEEKGICWVEHIEFGRKLSELTGVPYYWRGGVNAQGKPIEDHPPGTPMIASIASNSEGRNLQAWSTNYITSPPTTGAACEQLIGRTHRDGQEADEVSVIIPIMIKEQVAQFDGAIRDAKYISQTTGQEQKLCYADMDFVTVQEAPEGY